MNSKPCPPPYSRKSKRITMTKHKSGCPALGGYGHGVEPCICGADQIGIDKQENKPSTDDLIAHQRQLLENYQANPVVTLIAREILASLIDYKRIQEAKVPEPVVWFSADPKNVYAEHPLMIDSGTFWRCKHGTTGINGELNFIGCEECKKEATPRYGPEVLDLLRRETAKNERIKELLREAYEVYAGMEGTPIPQTACEAYLLRIIMEMQKPLSAALLAEVEKEQS
jgi:hypothetical protein